MTHVLFLPVLVNVGVTSDTGIVIFVSFAIVIYASIGSGSSS